MEYVNQTTARMSRAPAMNSVPATTAVGQVPAPRPPSEISEGVQVQTQVNEEIHELLSALENKIEPILSPAEPVETDAKPQAPAQTSLGASLVRNYSYTKHAVSRLQHLLNRIKL